jgi:hypothetical protein
MSESKLNRRSFLKKTALAGGASAGALAAPAVLAQAPIVLKMQTSWGASNIWDEFAKDYASRVDEMSGGRLKIEVLPAGAVVGAFQVLDAVNDGVLDAAHSVPVYWYGKSKAASLFGTGPVFGGSATTMLSWFYEGGGAELYRELTQDILGLDVVGYMGFPMFAQPFRLVQRRSERSSRPQRLQVPYSWPRGRPSSGNGYVGCSASGWRNRPRYGARRDRRIRVQQPIVGQRLRRP